jgi:hypothetical protein
LHDFHHDRGRYRVGPASGRDGRVPAIWQVALALGRPALVLNVPYTSPVQPWRAIQLAGIDAPGENAPGFDRAPGELSPHAPHGWGLRHRLMLFLTVRAFTDLPLRRLAAIETAWIASRSPTSAVTVLPLGPGIAEARMAVLLLALVPALLASASAIPVRMETTPGRVLVAGLRAAPAAIGPGTGDSRGGLGDGADLAPGGRHD